MTATALEWVTCPDCFEPDQPSKYGFIICLNDDCPTNAYVSVWGKRFALTGTLSQLQWIVSRDITRNGGIVVQSVSNQTDFLVKGNGYRSVKETKAIKLGVPIIDEATLRKMIEISNGGPA